MQGCEVSPFLRGTPPGPVKIAYSQGVSLTRGGTGFRLFIGICSCGLGSLFQVHEEVFDIIIEAVGARQAQAKTAAVQGGHTLTLHTFQVCFAYPWLQLWEGHLLGLPPSSPHPPVLANPSSTFTRIRVFSLGLPADKSCPKPR